MTTLIFIATFLTVVILFISIIMKVVKHKSAARTFRTMAIVLVCYGLLWVTFYFKSREVAVPFGTDVCFDDWCATVTQAERVKSIGNETAQGQFIVLHVRMSNHARGIAQKPSEPRVHIIDGQGRAWAFSKEGQQALEGVAGKQVPVDARLELNESLSTQLVFDVSQGAKNIKAIIEEGPFITQLLLRGDREVFVLR